MIIKSKIHWASGAVTERLVDYANPAERKRFACLAHAALSDGGLVLTYAADRTHIEPQGADVRRVEGNATSTSLGRIEA